MNALKKIAFFSICFLAACTTQHRSIESLPQQPTEKNEKKQANSLSSWELSGAMAARNQHKGWSAALNWVQEGSNQYQIRLNGPLGGGAAIIDKKGGVLTYTDGAKKVSSSNAEALLLEKTGIRLPVNNLYYWVRGLKAPGAVVSSQFDQQHHLKSLAQAGYIINYSHYTTINHIDLPGKIQLQGHGVVIKLVIKHWRV